MQVPPGGGGKGGGAKGRDGKNPQGPWSFPSLEIPDLTSFPARARRRCPPPNCGGKKKKKPTFIFPHKRVRPYTAQHVCVFELWTENDPGCFFSRYIAATPLRHLRLGPRLLGRDVRPGQDFFKKQFWGIHCFSFKKFKISTAAGVHCCLKCRLKQCCTVQYSLQWLHYFCSIQTCFKVCVTKTARWPTKNTKFWH